MKLLSIIIPYCNSQDYMEKAIKSCDLTRIMPVFNGKQAFTDQFSECVA